MSPALHVNVFTAPEKEMVGERARPFGPLPAFDPSTSTLIFGENDAGLIDTLTTVAEAEALANWVALHHRNLTTIYIAHGHFDHFAGLSVLLQRFPEARAIATPKSVELMRKQSQAIPFFRKRWPGQLPPRLCCPNPTTRTSLPSRTTSCASSNKAAPTPSTPPLCTCHLSTSWSAATSSTTSATCTSATPRRKAALTSKSFTLMAGLAAVTSRIQLFATCAVLTMPPAFAARMAVTIDSISHGRSGINIISGWQRREYEQMGIWSGAEHYKRRYQYCAEYVTVMQELWATGRSDFKGDFFRMDDCRWYM